MQTAKIIIGAIIGFFALITMVQIAGEERGAGLAGAFTGFLLFGGLAGWLIYSGVKGNQKKNQE
jgi:hypothetical protein